MRRPQNTNRRKVLKTISVGVVGATVLTGSSSASQHTVGVTLEGLDFVPEGVTVN